MSKYLADKAKTRIQRAPFAGRPGAGMTSGWETGCRWNRSFPFRSFQPAVLAVRSTGNRAVS